MFFCILCFTTLCSSQSSFKIMFTFAAAVAECAQHLYDGQAVFTIEAVICDEQQILHVCRLQLGCVTTSMYSHVSLSAIDE